MRKLRNESKILGYFWLKNSVFNIVTLPHPVHCKPAKFCFDETHKKIYEIVMYNEPHRSWFIDETVKSDASMLMLTPVHPVFLVLPHIKEQCSSRAVPLEDLVLDKKFNKVFKFLADLNNVADLKGPEDLRAYKYNETKTLSWLESKVHKVAKELKEKNIHVSSEFYLKYALGIIAEYVEADIVEKLESKFDLKPDLMESLGQKRKSRIGESNNKRIKSDQTANGSDLSESMTMQSSNTANKQKPFRPRTIDDIVDQGEVVQVLRQCLSGGDLPHLLFYGPPGTGKTSAILAAARQLFGDITRDRVLELNASDERGIQVVRDKVKSFAQLTVSSTKADGQPCPPYKLVILDEADSMTTAAQAALRRTMERETRTTRFCLICNYVSRIIPPITSRCSKFRFKPLARENVIKRLREICEAEGVEVGEGEVLHQAVDTCEGDLRRALTALHFLMEAFSASQLLEQASAATVMAGHLTNKQKCAISEKLAVCAHRLQDGGAEVMQLTDLGCTIIMANNNP
ncbi:hypothetical protein MSG28_000506 [Choristoneura fumiferana]|uniref:Uncharacterized protein n=1 Tax=Choristoneura fumiferana TaxID=7141 RepID=A0ACC0K1M8_CHOFU|nr:hypothetical protein MSG28_000506 [Choristoneura fumiferana]